MKNINIKSSRHVLTIGPEFNSPKGGIEMVLMSYSQTIPDFQFLSSWKQTSKIKVIFHFIKQLPKIFYKLWKDKEIEIVHLHGSYKGSLIRKLILLFLIKTLFRKKIIYHSHGSQFEKIYESAGSCNKFIMHELIEHSDSIICLSVSWKRFFETNFNCKSIYVLKNIINKPIIISKKNSKRNVIKFLFLGILGERKGIFDLLNVIIKYRYIFESKIEIHIGGNGETEKVQNIIKTNHLEPIIIFHGWVSGIKKIELLNDSDVFILPSYNEGLPIAILEAMSYGMPIISTNVGGIPEVIETGVNGFLVNPGNLKELKKAIHFFMTNVQYIDSFGEISKFKSLQFFPENVLNDLNIIYTDLLK